MIDFARERFVDVEGELQALADRHWSEIRESAFPPMEMDLPVYRKADAAGSLAVFTARTEGMLVGYVMHWIFRAPHYPIRIAQDDAHYLAPEYRKGWNAVRLFRFAEEQLKAMGVKQISYHHKTRIDLDKGTVFERMGYQPVERIYRKDI